MRVQPQKATRQQTKSYNSNLVLKTIYDQGRVSRADVARLTNLTRTSVSEMVSELQERGLVEEVGIGQSIGGRSPILLSVVDDGHHLISLDLAGAPFRGALVNLRNDVFTSASVPVRSSQGEAALERVYELLDTLLGKTNRPVLGIGIGTPGLVDTTSGVIVRAVNLGWRDLPISDILQRRYGLPVYVANDSQISALARYMFGKGLDSNLVVIKTGRFGVGAGIVLNGQLFQGDGFGAGEIGHIVVEEDGEQCSCGNFGCLETVVSAQGIARRARALAAAHPHSMLHPLGAGITLQAIRKGILAGDEVAHRVVEETGHFLGIACANLIGALNVRHLVLTGTLTALGIPLLEAVRKKMYQRSLPILAKDTYIELAAPDPDAVIRGASVLVLTHELGFSLTR
ncbi:MAG: ROK family transcriptional regulator [Chloroflexia bacterium]